MTKGLTRFFLLIYVLAHAGVSFAQGEPAPVSNQAATPQVQATLVASVEAVHPGTDIYLGVHQKIIPHWHTYWINPGDSGMATSIEWTLPEGATASEILWPAPSRFNLGDITNYAYENDVTLLTRISVPASLNPGELFSVTAEVDWLVCEYECIPQQVTLALSLPVVAQGEPVGEADPRIAQALARLPVASPWPVTAYQSEIDPDSGKGELQIDVHLPAEQIAQVKDIWFYPYDWGRIQQSKPQLRKNLNDGIQLQIPSGEAPVKIGETVRGVLVIAEQQELSRGYEIAVPAQTKAITTDNGLQDNKLSIGFFTALLFALLGGIILNLMPCVFPVLSIKALSLVSHANHSQVEVRRQGYAYTLGVLASFALLAILLMMLKAGSAHIGWGFQFQSPVFVLLMAYLLFAVGLSLSGVFFIGGSASGLGTSLTEKPGYTGSFFTGVLATLVATPCTAPFMAAALGYAIAQPALQLLAIFLSLGFGLALPYLLLSCWPRLQHWLPRPGAWMERTKQFLAFPMYAAAIWLVWVLIQQAGVDAVIIALGGMLLIALGAWIYDSTRTGSDKRRLSGTFIGIVLVLVASILGSLSVNSSDVSVEKPDAANQHWENYSEERLQQLLADNKPVFLNFTASWCISCLVNERVALSTDVVKNHFQQEGIVYLKGDWTNKDEHITAFLQKFNRSGVPLYVFYPAGQADAPIELPQILTPDIVISAVSKD